MTDGYQKTALITGITGQDGALLARLLLSKGYHVAGVYRQDAVPDTSRLAYLGIDQSIQLEGADLTEPDQCKSMLRRLAPDELYNLAAQSSVSYSFNHPRETLEFNIISVLNLLEAIRAVNPAIRMYQASSSEMYGKAERLPITLETRLHPISPYGISKATGHWMVSQYREAYGLYAVSGILFNHESYLRPESFFVKKVIRSAIRIKRGEQKVLQVGNIDIKRDFGLATEYVKAIWMVMQLEQPEDFLVCSGSSIALRDIVYYVFDQLGLDRSLIIHDTTLDRPTEILDIYGDKTKIEAKTDWKYPYTIYEVLNELINEEIQNGS